MSALDKLYEEIANCEKCSLHKCRTKAVPGEGPSDADIMFIGEAPGYHEDQKGRPFVGHAGKFLDHLLSLINLDRSKVYITNVVKGRPTGNRDPLPDEMAACRPWLNRQIEIIKPKMIVTLGRYSMAMYFPGKTIGKIHGKAMEKDGVIYFPMYHPAAALHQYALRKTIEEDMKLIPQLLKECGCAAEEGEDPSSQQLNLF